MLPFFPELLPAFSDLLPFFLDLLSSISELLPSFSDLLPIFLGLLPVSGKKASAFLLFLIGKTVDCMRFSLKCVRNEVLMGCNFYKGGWYNLLFTPISVFSSILIKHSCSLMSCRASTRHLFFIKSFKRPRIKSG